MRPLIDADILRYEIGAGGQYYKKNEDGSFEEELTYVSFAIVAEKLDQRIKEICSLVWATEPPLIFLSMDAKTKKRENKRKKKQIDRLKKEYDVAPMLIQRAIKNKARAIKATMEYKPNFREKIAKKAVYKGNRKDVSRPYHYHNLTEYIKANYEVVMAEGLEADDLLSVYQHRALKECSDPTTIICSRDKDLRMVPGLHFGWEVGTEGKKGYQRQFGPELVKGTGKLIPRYDSGILTRGPYKGERKLKAVKGLGILFFGAQLIMGDAGDNIPGLPGKGMVPAYYLLRDVKTEEEMFIILQQLYHDKFGDEWEEAMLEQGRLLWMAEELNDDGSVVMWSIPEVIHEE